MKRSLFDLALLALMAACLLNILMNTGCVTHTTDKQPSVNPQGLDRAMGKYYDSPIY